MEKRSSLSSFQVPYLDSKTNCQTFRIRHIRKAVSTAPNGDGECTDDQEAASLLVRRLDPARPGSLARQGRELSHADAGSRQALQRGGRNGPAVAPGSSQQRPLQNGPEP